MRVRWRGLELPSEVHSDRGTLTDTYGKFYVEPFERGFGMTIGNSLRRILLSSLEGSRDHPGQDSGRAARDLDHHRRRRGRHRHHPQHQVAGREEPLRSAEGDPHPEARGRRRSRRGRAARRDDPDHQPRAPPRDAHERRVVRHGDDRRERPRLPHRRRQRRQGTRDRRHPGRFELLAGRARQVRHRGDPRRSEDELRPAHHGDLDQRHDRAADGAGRGREDPPQAPEPVRAVHRAGAGGRARRADRDRRRPPRRTRSTPTSNAS